MSADIAKAEPSMRPKSGNSRNKLKQEISFVVVSVATCIRKKAGHCFEVRHYLTLVMWKASEAAQSADQNQAQPILLMRQPGNHVN